MKYLYTSVNMKNGSISKHSKHTKQITEHRPSTESSIVANRSGPSGRKFVQDAELPDFGTLLSAQTSLGGIEEIESLLLDWHMVESKATALEERESDVENFEQLLSTAEQTRFSGSITFAFEAGYLKTMSLETRENVKR